LSLAEFDNDRGRAQFGWHDVARLSGTGRPSHALGNLAPLVLLPGERHDSIGVEPLITGLDFNFLIADKAFDNDALRAMLKRRGALRLCQPAKPPSAAASRGAAP
jgi:hypothetical protein